MTTAGQVRFKARAARLLLALLALVAGGGVLWYRGIGLEVGPQAPTDLPENDRQAEMVTRDFRHVETRLDRTVWILEAARAEIFGESARLHTVKITWYGETGTLPVTITSGSGEVDFRDRKAVLAGAVRVERTDGSALATERLIWDEKRKHLRANQPVVITTPSFTFRGQRFDANLDAEQFLLHGGVEGEIRGGRPGQRPS